MKEQANEELDRLVSTITSLLACYSKTHNLEVADEIIRCLTIMRSHTKLDKEVYKETYLLLQKHWVSLSNTTGNEDDISEG